MDFINNGSRAFDIPAGASLTLRQASPGATAVAAQVWSDGPTGFTSAPLTNSTPVTIGPLAFDARIIVAAAGSVSVDSASGGAAGAWSGLSDKATANLPVDNTPLAAALAAKAPGGAVVALPGTTLTLSAALHNGNIIVSANAAATTVSLDTTSDLTAGAVIVQGGAGIVTVNGSATNTFPNGASTSGVGTSLVITPTAVDTYTVAAAQTGDSTLVNAAAGATPAIDMAKYNVFDLTLTANCTPAFTGAVAGKSFSAQLILRQDGTGGRTLTLPTTIWPGGTDFAVSSAIGAVSVVTLQTVDGGATYLGYIGGNAFAT